MLNKAIPVVLSAALMVGLAGCADNREEVQGGGGGGMTTTQRDGGGAGMNAPDRATERAATQRADNWGTNLTDDKRNFAQAYVRAPWVHANLLAGEWEQAGEDLQYIRDTMTDLRRSQNIPVAVRNELNTLDRSVTTLANQITRHDRAAVQGASNLVSSMNRLANDRSVVAWMGPAGGGAGGTPQQKHDNP
jgi:hypothetical protein